jgi:hypothetical protein
MSLGLMSRVRWSRLRWSILLRSSNSIAGCDGNHHAICWFATSDSQPIVSCASGMPSRVNS